MSQPTIRLSMAITPTSFALGDETCTLAITATLEYTHPITVYTWASIFNLPLAQRRHNFTCVDLSDHDKNVRMSVEEVKRAGFFSVQVGHPDDEHLVTFHPGVPVTITGKFDMATRNFSETLQPGHRYRFGIGREGSHWSRWFHGTRQEIMTVDYKTGRESERSQIDLDGCEDVEFEAIG